MIGRINNQMNFFDAEIFKRISKNDILVKINEVVNFDEMAKKVECYYDEDQGRPSLPITTMIKTLFLEIYCNISDRELERQVKYNFLYRYFLSLSFYDEGLEHSSISVFRSRIGAEGAKEIFDEIVRQAKNKGVLVGKIKSVDATHVEANIAKENVVNFLRHARKKILGLFKKENPEKVEEVVELEKEYLVKEKTYHKSTEEEIEKEVKKSWEFIEKIRIFCGDKVLLWLNLLGETLNKIVKKEINRVVSFVDVDARWGHKTKEKTFLGYKVHTVQDESRIVTSVDTLSGNENEGVKLIKILKEDKEKGIEGTGVVGDKLYDNIDNRKGSRRLGLIPYILSKISRRKMDKFHYNVEADIVSCKAGKEPKGKIKQGRGWLYYFSINDCNKCIRGDECLGEGGKRQRVYLSESERDRLLVGKAVTREKAKEIRATVEAKYGEGKSWHGLGRARWRGKWRMAIQSFITFGVMNAKRLVRLIEKKGKTLCPAY